VVPKPSLVDVKSALDRMKDQGRIVRQGDGYVPAQDELLTPFDVSDIL